MNQSRLLPKKDDLLGDRTHKFAFSHSPHNSPPFPQCANAATPKDDDDLMIK
jgi:hypothetical protein